MLTPIRIRGKNTRDRPRKNKPDQNTTAAKPIRPRGRPLKRSLAAAVPSSSHSTASPSVSGSAKRRRQRPKPPPAVKLSPLESLPVELLQRIFLYSLNTALPLCSPRLCSALSSKHVKIELVARVFFVRQIHRFEGKGPMRWWLEVDAETFEWYSSLQSALLRLKWMTVELFKECIETFILRTAAREFGALLIKHGVGEPMPTAAEYRKLLEDRTASPRFDIWSLAPSPGYLKMERKVRDGRLLALRVSRQLLAVQINICGDLPDGTPSITDLPREEDILFCQVPCSEGVHLQSRLLHGPWTNERCEFLELLLGMGYSIDWLNSTQGEVAEKGLEDAIREGNLRALGLLVATVRPPGFEIEGERENSKNTVGEDAFEYGRTVHEVEGREYVHVWRDYVVHVGVLPRTSHLRLAVIECDCPPDTVYHLLGADTSCIDLEDRMLVGWAIEKRKQKDCRGKWLLKLLRKALVPPLVLD